MQKESLRTRARVHASDRLIQDAKNRQRNKLRYGKARLGAETTRQLRRRLLQQEGGKQTTLDQYLLLTNKSAPRVYNKEALSGSPSRAGGPRAI